MHKLHVIFAATRDGRAGEPVARWITERARTHGKFETTFVDLREVNLPLFDEPKHPRAQQYEHAHTKAWSKTIAEADAFVFVLPEYNFSMPPAFVNALDYLVREWEYKACGLTTYGGISAGLRCAQMAKQLITALKMMPLPEAVSIPNFTQFIDAEKQFKANEPLEKSATLMLEELHRWTGALKTLR